MKKVRLDDIAVKYALSDYKELYQKVLELIDKQKIKPVKASGKNGKSPALFREYWILEAKQDITQYIYELNYEIVPAIFTDYYKTHLDQYIEDRQWVLLLNDYLRKNKEQLKLQMSENERSFDIWHREKFLKQEQGRKILKRCGMDEAYLSFYRTTEPIAYYSVTKKTPQNMLVVENKDTFYSMRQWLLEGNEMLMGEPIGTLIYGAGKGILAAFSDFETSAEPYMIAPGNRIYYFGDLDYEGIGIYENFATTYGEQYEILLFVKAYEMMLSKANTMFLDERGMDLEKLPETKEGQNRKIGTLFLSSFSKMQQRAIMEILSHERYIPQEILNRKDFI